MFPNFKIEQDLISKGCSIIAGVDEVGRGPLAGPVTAAAVILDPLNIPDNLNDSKVLSSKKREKLFEELKSSSICAVAHVSPEEIDKLNILQASLLAMVNAVTNLKVKPKHILIDGNTVPDRLVGRATAIVKGDREVLSIAAASIIAKVTRDKLMHDLGSEFPVYGWAKNAGYPTKCHMNAIVKYGVTPHHRRSFKPVHNILCG
ncbi:ribonuclease HII [Paracoccaceae bacterium]|nr:ribonuclease HII [Paracoccaceae bacterium]|tara:strand:+ start:153 stop:764 length:612 start_codon:yes stop_codon:yes gene_type:complete